MTPHGTSSPTTLPPVTDAVWLTVQQRFLRWGILLSVLLHVGLIAWQRTIPPVPAPRPSELEIVLVNAGTESEPSQARLLAQMNVDGGGLARENYATSQLPQTGETTERVMIETLTKKRQQLEHEQQQLLTQVISQQKLAQGRPATTLSEANPRPGEDEQDQDSLILNSQITVLTDRIARENARPRKHFDAPSTRQVAFAPYIDQWRQRIEQVGTEHYPSGLEGKSYGTVQATLTIRADGSIADITINRPSNLPLLNQAVRRIAQLAAPFGPFPANMARQVDQIVLTRTWHFVNGALETQTLETPSR